MNINYNNVCNDYIGATGIYSISDYIDNTSNVIESHLLVTSNILNTNSSNYTSNTSNYIINRYDELIKKEIEEITIPIPATLYHTYIYNSNVVGEIRFWCESTSDYPVVIPVGVPDYRVKIAPNGHLMCYYTYDPAINLTFGNGWIDIGNSIVALNASDANIGISIGGLEIQIKNNFQILQEQLTTLLLALQTNSILTSQQATNINNFIEAQLEATRLGQQQLGNVFLGVRNFYTSGQISYLQIAANVITTRISNNPAISFVVGLGGIAFAAIASAIGNLSYAEHTLSQITSNIINMSGITETRRTELLEETRIEQIQSLIDYTSNIYNMTLAQGFINSNVSTQQTIPKLKSNEIKLNNKTITKFSLDALEDWIRTPNGIYYDITNGNLGISGTPTLNDFLVVGGQTTIQGDIICETKMKIDNTTIALPATGINGGVGDRLILKPGASGIYPYSIGVNTNILWFSVPSGVSQNFYVNGTRITSISSAGLSTTGAINATTNLQENSVNLSSKYLRLDGTNTMTGTLNGTTINASTNLQENSVNLSSKYLRLDGTNVMTGQITGITNLSASTGLFSKVATTNTTNVNTPQFGAQGGNGDKLILYAGSVSLHPYSIGINNNVLWYSSPIGSSHIFYVNGSAITTISSTGLSTTGIINASANLQEAGTNLTSKYLQLIGGALTGNLTTNSQITGITTLSASTGLFSKVATTNNTNVNTPQFGVQGGTGDKIIIYNGTVSTYPYSIGINTNELWYSVPSGVSQKFYINGSLITTISNTEILLKKLTKIDTSGTLDQSTLQLIAGSGTTNRASRINFLNTVAHATTPRWTVINDFSQNGTNDLRIVNASDTAALTILQNGDIYTLNNFYAGGNASDGGLRINGKDWGNTIYQNATTVGGQPANIGFTLRDNNKFRFISFSSAGVYTEIMNMNTTAITLNEPTIINGNVGINTTDVSNYRININGSARIANTLSMGETLTAPQINLLNSIGGDNVLYISSMSSTANNCIQFKNNSTYYAYIGVGGSALGGNYQNNLFLESQTGAIILNTNGRTSSSTPNFLIKTNGNIETSGNIAIGTNNSDTYKLNVNGSANINGSLRLLTDTWLTSSDGQNRFYFANNALTYYKGYGQYTTDINHIWLNHNGTNIMSLSHVGALLLNGEIIPTMTSVANSGTDYCGVSVNTVQNSAYQTSIKIMYGTFTGFHRCFTDDIEFNQEDPQKFKDDYIGRIVISSGKIATDFKSTDDEEWNIKYDKEGITIEDSLPIIQLSRKKKDKRVFGVLGMSNRANSRPERMIVNSVGEGAMYCCSSNGNIENGDYIQSSNYLGYGEKQDEIFLCNYTLAKATMDCNFELDSPLYECKEIDDLDLEGNRLRVAFIAVTYHCG
jgi:hypothetical protein